MNEKEKKTYEQTGRVPQENTGSGGSTSASKNTAENEQSAGPSPGIRNDLHIPQYIELPKGGGAIRGIGEKAEVNPADGSGTVNIPLPMTPGRSEFTPPLALSYSSGSGNSEFGLGWNIGIAEISRKTEKELPRYYDKEESDTFIISGAEDLVPVTGADGKIKDYGTGTASVIRYRPRTEGFNSIIERITETSGNMYWQVTSPEHVISLYGYDPVSRIADPVYNNRIFSWRLRYSLDSYGNLIKYNYEKEQGKDYESIYLSSVEYGNASPVRNISGAIAYSGTFYFRLKFEYNTERTDAFSVFRPGFEVRNNYLCRSVEMWHNIQGSRKVKSLELSYENSTGLNLLSSAQLKGYETNNTVNSLPPVDLKYTLPEIPLKVKNIDTVSLENLPAGIGADVSFSDLWGEGLSGALIQTGKCWYYKSNNGNRSWYSPEDEDSIELGKATPLKELPSLITETSQLTDIDGDGLNEILVFAAGRQGWHALDEEGRPGPFVPFREMPGIDLNDPNIKMIDLDGDGFPDILFSSDDCFLVSYSKQKDGYGKLQRISKDIDEEKGPRVVFSELKQSIFIADMSGDGLNDIVSINNGNISYWPNLGYGRFGRKRVMKNSPLFEHPDIYDPSRLRLADINGSGTTDVIYLGTQGTYYWINRSGNEWSGGLEIKGFPPVGSVDSVSVFDIEGNGTSAIVWSTPLPERPDRIKYIELTGGKKPFLLNEVHNNMGAVRRLFYTPSTKFYLQDKRTGRPWITKLGFPVHVVERMEIYDEPTQSKYVSRYAYHHGYFDGMEREFRGFGMVEQWDTDLRKVGGSTSLTNQEESWSLSGAEGSTEQGLVSGVEPPVYTKTWFHTGFYKGSDKISELYKQEYYNADENWMLPDTVVPEDLEADEKREAARTLKGSILRQEVYSQDGSEKENIPYTVTENSYTIKTVQRKQENKHSVFRLLPGENIVLNYERQANDPRITHSLNLEYDSWGNPLKQAEVFYKRLSQPEAGQDKTLVKIIKTDYFNSDDTTGFHRIGVPYQQYSYETKNFAARSSRLSAQELSSVGESSMTYINAERTYFINSQNQWYNLGQINAQALPYNSQKLCYSREMLERLCQTEGRTNAFTLEDSFTRLAGMNYVNDGNNARFWLQTEKQKYDLEGFYQPVQHISPEMNITYITYDSYKLLPVKVKDPLGYETIIDNNYDHLQPYRITDPNGNGTELKFNSLGMVTAEALFGKNSQGDTPASPTAAYIYNLHNWTDSQKPVYVHTSVKTTHGSAGTAREEIWEYSDGLERDIMVKQKAEDGPAYSVGADGTMQLRSQVGTRFVASGRKVYNNKGDIIRQYEPWFSVSSGYEPGEALVNFGVSPLMTYDPLGRNVRTDFPDGSTTKVEFNAWQQFNYDRNDCDPASPHYNTPQRIYINPCGFEYKTIDDNGSYGNNVVTTRTLDIEGRPIEIKDALGRIMTVNIYDYAGRAVYTRNIDSGTRWMLYSALGNIRYLWDSRGHLTESVYDPLDRLLYENTKQGNNAEKRYKNIIYGTSRDKNDIGRISTVQAQDGKTTYEYDFKGNAVKLTKQFPQAWDVQPDYLATVSLQSATFTTQTTCDALNRPLTVKYPDNSQVTNTYNPRGMLSKVRHGTTDYITNITYTARGEREAVYYGNNTKTAYEYDPRNFRLTRILTTRNTGSVKLQDINYEYDAGGNITKQTDNAQQTVYFSNTVVKPESAYEYDSLYRLVKATGREKKSLSAPGYTDIPDHIGIPQADTNAMQVYTHRYSFDGLGNILSDPWKSYVYDTATNRLRKHNATQTTDDYAYDAHGNMTRMPHLTLMAWDNQDMLIKAGNGSFTDHYSYDAEGNRSRKVTVKGSVREERYYIGDYEVYRKYNNSTLQTERTSLNIKDDSKCFVIIDNRTVGQEAPGNTTRYQYDNHLGSACLELDTSGNIISYEEYHPYGTTSYRSGKSTAEVSLKRYKYNGKERDNETGLYYYGARYYAAWVCRFVSVDPLQFEYEYYTPYQYTGNMPVTYVDLDGLEPARKKDKKDKKDLEDLCEPILKSILESKKFKEKHPKGLNKRRTQKYKKGKRDSRSFDDNGLLRYESNKKAIAIFLPTEDDTIDFKIADLLSSETKTNTTTWHHTQYFGLFVLLDQKKHKKFHIGGREIWPSYKRKGKKYSEIVKRLYNLNKSRLNKSRLPSTSKNNLLIKYNSIIKKKYKNHIP